MKKDRNASAAGAPITLAQQDLFGGKVIKMVVVVAKPSLAEITFVSLEWSI